jgi:hypothetical protein
LVRAKKLLKSVKKSATDISKNHTYLKKADVTLTITHLYISFDGDIFVFGEVEAVEGADGGSGLDYNI